MYGERMTTRAIRVDLDTHSIHMFSFIKNDLNVRNDAEVIRILIKEGFDRRRSQSTPFLVKTKAKLTEEEKQKLYSWAIVQSGLAQAEEAEIAEHLAENLSTWPWLAGKVTQCVEYILSLKK